MIEKIGKPAMLEQLAEESVELAKAALKYARVLRGENPTPITEVEAEKALEEEYTDVITCAQELRLMRNISLEAEKRKRFEERWKKMQLVKNQKNGSAE